MKTVNYTVEQTKQVVDSYVSNPSAETIATLAKDLGKTVKSIVAKLSREGVYKVATKAKKERVSKEALAKELASALNISVAPEKLSVLTVETLNALIEGAEALNAQIAEMTDALTEADNAEADEQL